MKTDVLVLFGPTASGKTALLERLFGGGGDCLSNCRAEIISADSMQVYRGMDIGTAKPSPRERAKIPHHLIDIRDPNEQFNAGEFVRLAEEACFAVAGRGALPVVSGGTGFYLNNLVQGLSEAPPSDPEIRWQLKEELALRGTPALMEELARTDPVSAGRIHINDRYRLLRALEVSRLSGRPLSSFPSAWNPGPGKGKFRFHGNFRFRLIGLRRRREELYSRINGRTAEMFRSGLRDEVKRLCAAGYTPFDPGLRAIGYREFFIVNPDNSWRISEDMPGVEALAAQNSRRYAKRQITFFASVPGVAWIDMEREAAAAENIGQMIKDFAENAGR
jgi:tRNA dimethylallyltransferase